MSQLTFPVSPDGLSLDAVIGLDAATCQALMTAGQPIPAPMPVKAIIDTGTDITAVASPIIERLGMPVRYTASTHTATGLVKANLFEVSLALTDFGKSGAPWLVESSWIVMELSATLPGIDALIGLDLLRKCRFLLDGPVGQFTLEF